MARVEKGERITVARTGKPVARLVPAELAHPGTLPSEDPLLNLEKFEFEGPGGSPTNSEIDQIVYGR